MIRTYNLISRKELKFPTIFLTFDLGQEYLFHRKSWDWATWTHHAEKLGFPRELNFLFSLKSLCSPPHPPDFVDVFSKFVEPNKPILKFSGFEAVSDYSISALDCNLTPKGKIENLQLNENIKNKIRSDSTEEIVSFVLELTERKGIDLLVIPYYKIEDRKLGGRKDIEKILKKNLELLHITWEEYSSTEYPFDLIIPVQLSYNSQLSDSFLEKIDKFVSKIDHNELYVAYGTKLGFPLRRDDVRFDLKKLGQIRSMWPNVFIHALGAGSATTAPLYLLNNADSSDSTSWSRKGGVKKVMEELYEGEKRVGELKTKSATNKVPEVEWESWSCDCPICQGKEPDEIRELFVKSGRIPCRIHNAWMIYKSVWKLREKVRQNDKTFLEDLNNKLKKKLSI